MRIAALTGIAADSKYKEGSNSKYIDSKYKEGADSKYKEGSNDTTRGVGCQGGLIGHSFIVFAPC